MSIFSDIRKIRETQEKLLIAQQKANEIAAAQAADIKLLVEKLTEDPIEGIGVTQTK